MTNRPDALSVDALRSPSFAALWLAQVASRFGDPITLVALAYVSYVQTRSALVTALAVVIATIPNAIFGMFGGAIADAVGHRRAMIMCDFGRVVLVGAVPIILALGLPLLVAYILVFAAAVCGAIFNPARLALVPRIVSPHDLPAANSLIYSSDRAVEVLGAVAAGLLVASIGDRAFYVDALSFLVSGVLLWRIRLEEEARPLAVRSLARETSEGIRFLWRQPVLRANTLLSLACQLSIPVVSSLTPVLIFRRFAGGNAERGASLFGVAEGAIATGAVVGGLYLGSRLIRFPKGRLILGGFSIYGLVLIALALAPTFELAALLFVLGGVANVVFYVPNITLSQEVAPPDLRARVFGARIAFLNLSWLPVILLSGALADVVDVTVLFAVAGAVTLVGALIGAFVPIVRDVP
ncbi:MAG: MFS transporter [Chloroflexota bacterium]|nr:MFS transporter [Chloroflexota bacterium]